MVVIAPQGPAARNLSASRGNGSCGHTLRRVAIASMTPSLMSEGCGEVKRMRSIPSIASVRRSSEPPAKYTEMSGVEFETYVQRLLERKGWKVETTPITRDRGIDLIARRVDEIGVETSLYIQCKNHASPVGVEVARALNGALPQQLSGIRGVLVCPSGFTASAVAFAKERDLVFWDRHQLFALAHE